MPKVTNEVLSRVIANCRELNYEQLTEVALIFASRHPVEFVNICNEVTAPLISAIDPKFKGGMEIAVDLGEKFVYKLTKEQVENIKNLCVTNDKVSAIKAFRTFTNAGLREGMAAIEELSAQGIFGGNFSSKGISVTHRML